MERVDGLQTNDMRPLPIHNELGPDAVETGLVALLLRVPATGRVEHELQRRDGGEELVEDCRSEPQEMEIVVGGVQQIVPRGVRLQDNLDVEVLDVRVLLRGALHEGHGLVLMVAQSDNGREHLLRLWVIRNLQFA